MRTVAREHVVAELEAQADVVLHPMVVHVSIYISQPPNYNDRAFHLFNLRHKTK